MEDTLPCQVLLTRIDPHLSEKLRAELEHDTSMVSGGGEEEEEEKAPRWIKRKCTQMSKHITRINRSCKQTISYREQDSNDDDDDDLPLASLAGNKYAQRAQSSLPGKKMRKKLKKAKPNGNLHNESSSEDDEPLLKKADPEKENQFKGPYIRNPMKDQYLRETVKNRKVMICITRLEEDDKYKHCFPRENNILDQRLNKESNMEELILNNKSRIHENQRASDETHEKLSADDQSKEGKPKGRPRKAKLSKKEAKELRPKKNETSYREESSEDELLLNFPKKSEKSKAEEVDSEESSVDELPLSNKSRTLQKNQKAFDETREKVDAYDQSKEAKKIGRSHKAKSSTKESKELRPKKNETSYREESLKDELLLNTSEISKNSNSKSKDVDFEERSVERLHKSNKKHENPAKNQRASDETHEKVSADNQSKEGKPKGRPRKAKLSKKEAKELRPKKNETSYREESSEDELLLNIDKKIEKSKAKEVDSEESSVDELPLSNKSRTLKKNPRASDETCEKVDADDKPKEARQRGRSREVKTSNKEAKKLRPKKNETSYREESSEDELLAIISKQNKNSKATKDVDSEDDDPLVKSKKVSSNVEEATEATSKKRLAKKRPASPNGSMSKPQRKELKKLSPEKTDLVLESKSEDNDSEESPLIKPVRSKRKLSEDTSSDDEFLAQLRSTAKKDSVPTPKRTKNSDKLNDLQNRSLENPLVSSDEEATKSHSSDSRAVAAANQGEESDSSMPSRTIKPTAQKGKYNGILESTDDEGGAATEKPLTDEMMQNFFTSDSDSSAIGLGGGGGTVQETKAKFHKNICISLIALDLQLLKDNSLNLATLPSHPTLYLS